MKDPTDQALELARNLARLRTDPRYRNKVLTELSDRAAAKREAERSLRPDEIAKMKFLRWEDVAARLQKLSREIIFSTLPDGKIAIGTRAPVRTEVSAWENTILSPVEREEVKRLGHHQGPRPFISTASRGWVAPYTDLISEGAFPQIVCRSLVGILSPLVKARLFTWDEAEREFGFKLRGPGCERQAERVPVTPKVWAENPQTQVGVPVA